jgi:hypothetical protein
MGSLGPRQLVLQCLIAPEGLQKVSPPASFGGAGALISVPPDIRLVVAIGAIGNASHQIISLLFSDDVVADDTVHTHLTGENG